MAIDLQSARAMKLSAFFPFLVLVAAQLAGEFAARYGKLPVPGSVIGAVLLFMALWLVPGLHAKIAPFSHTLLRNMLVLFVPASVGMMSIYGDIASQGVVLLVVSVLATWGTALVSALTFDAVRRLGQEEQA